MGDERLCGLCEHQADVRTLAWCYLETRGPVRESSDNARDPT